MFSYIFECPNYLVNLIAGDRSLALSYGNYVRALLSD